MLEGESPNMRTYYNSTLSTSLISISDSLCSVTFTKKYAVPGHPAEYIFKIIPK